MHKSRDSYAGLDLSQLASRIPDDRPARLRSEELGEMLWAIAYRCSTERITAEQLQSWLGEPDTVRQLEDGLVWEYDWIGIHCGHQHSATSPFLIKDGQVLCLHRDGRSAAL